MDLLRHFVIDKLARTLLLAAGAFALTLFSGYHWVNWLRAHNIGKRIRVEGPQSHLVKTGTPTMGGLMIVGSGVILTALFNLVGRLSMLLPLSVLVSFSILGGFDDFLTITRSRADSEQYGVPVSAKFIWIFLIALIAALALYLPYPWGLGNGDTVIVPFLGPRHIGYLYIPFAVLIIISTANAVNITDGLDGLAAWLLVLAFASYGMISFIAFPRLTNLTAFSFTMVGACAAFLWYNAHPAQVFMGDTGSLALGAALGVVALQSQYWLLLPVIGIVFVAEAASSGLQTLYFKYTRRRYGTGRRIFRMAPLHHHFEQVGWSETQTMQRFVLIGMIAALVGISLALTTPDSRGVIPADQWPIDHQEAQR
ncbi:MAG: phospho-N-acetylmuramoyl-pentapeptide-transferase [Herpetosiphon sp.]